MSATTASAPGRRVLRASAIGLGLLVSIGVLTPPALAATDAAVPSSSVSAPTGTVHVQLAAAPAPADLDLSGARFDVLDPSGAVLGSCGTGASGACDVPLAQYAGTATTYRLVQEAGAPVPGLVPSAVELPVLLCPPDAADCSDPAITVTDGSLFRSGLSVTVRDGNTQEPVAGAEYSLTGPDYPHVPAVAPGAGTTYFPAPTLSGPDGRLTFAGWFLPGEWSLVPEVTPRGYQSSGVLPLTLAAPTAGPGAPWATTIDLAPDAVTLIGTVGGPARPPVAAPPSTGSPAPVPAPAAPPASNAPASAPVAVPSSVAPPSAPASPVVPATPTDAAPAPLPDDAGAASPPVAAAPTAAAAPLRAAASAYRLDAGEIAFAVLFLASVMVGVGVVRRRLRER